MLIEHSALRGRSLTLLGVKAQAGTMLVKHWLCVRGGTVADRFDMDDPRLATAAWSRLAEPGDIVASAMVASMGAVDALRWFDDVVHGRASLPRQSRTEATGVLDISESDASAPIPSHARLAKAVERWKPRWEVTDPRREFRVLERLGGRLVIPGDELWPAAVSDLGLSAPLALWIRGHGDVGALLQRSVAIVGSRACTEYGRHVADELTGGLAPHTVTAVSGGAYGIDAAVHRAALMSGTPTVAFLAGGVDRLYPAGNADLLRAIMTDGGLLISEVPPGSVPNRVRFLHRNRLIAASAQATIVVEAAWRSGSLSTAARANELARPVGAVPGPVTSPASAGCHRLLRDGAVCITGADDVMDLVGAMGAYAGSEPPTRDRPGDGLDPDDRAVWEALPKSRGASIESLARAAGVSVPGTRAAVGRLELDGLARRSDSGWSQAR